MTLVVPSLIEICSGLSPWCAVVIIDPAAKADFYQPRRRHG